MKRHRPTLPPADIFDVPDPDPVPDAPPPPIIALADAVDDAARPVLPRPRTCVDCAAVLDQDHKYRCEACVDAAKRAKP